MAGSPVKRYRIVMDVETTRRMVGSDEFLLCTAQRAGIKRRMNKVRVLREVITERKPK